MLAVVSFFYTNVPGFGFPRAFFSGSGLSVSPFRTMDQSEDLSKLQVELKIIDSKLKKL